METIGQGQVGNNIRGIQDAQLTLTEPSCMNHTTISDCNLNLASWTQYQIERANCVRIPRYNAPNKLALKDEGRVSPQINIFKEAVDMITQCKDNYKKVMPHMPQV